MNALQITDIAPNGERLTEYATIWLCQGKIVIAGILEANRDGFPSIDAARDHVAALWPDTPVRIHESLNNGSTPHA
jgi:hypothetical protein